MNSEKMKEIKKALEHCGEKVTCQGCPEYNNEPVVDWFECKKNLLQKTITLINELEKENETKTDTIIDLLKKQEFYETEKLKQFATILKVKTVLTPAGWSVNIEDIEKTLKEVINYDIKSAKSKELL